MEPSGLKVSLLLGAIVASLALSPLLVDAMNVPECESVASSPTSGSSVGDFKVLNVWARDSDGTVATPVWSSLLWDTTFQFNLAAYWSEVTYGNLQYRGYEAFDADTPAH